MLSAKLQEALTQKANNFKPMRETEAFHEAKVCAAKLTRVIMSMTFSPFDACMYRFYRRVWTSC
jgi:hypothetical protein